jgi:hypothetical protein
MLLGISLDDLKLFQEARSFFEKDLQKDTFGFSGKINNANFSLSVAVNSERRDVPVVIINAQILSVKEKAIQNLTVYYEVLIEEKGKRLSGKIIFYSK